MSFKIGDRVRVVGLGFGISSPEYIGEEFTVKIVDTESWVRLKEDPLYFIWHPSLLELVVEEEDDIIRVGDLVEPIPVEELPSTLNTSTNILTQKLLISKGVWPKVVDRVTTEGIPRISLLNDDSGTLFTGIYSARFRKVKTRSQDDPNRKYIKVITKIREMEKRRESLGYKY